MVLGWRRPGRVGRCRIPIPDQHLLVGLFHVLSDFGRSIVSERPAGCSARFASRLRVANACGVVPTGHPLPSVNPAPRQRGTCGGRMYRYNRCPKGGEHQRSPGSFGPSGAGRLRAQESRLRCAHLIRLLRRHLPAVARLEFSIRAVPFRRRRNRLIALRASGPCSGEGGIPKG